MWRACVLGLFLTSCSHTPPENTLVLLVDARPLDYTDGQAFITSMQYSPDFGHAWFCLQTKEFCLEGGHTGECGVTRARYFDGVMDQIEQGKPDPISYMWAGLHDGYFEKGSGGHRPTYAIKKAISDEQLKLILGYIRNYDFSDYRITGNQCSTFVAQIASIAEIDLEDQVTLPINQRVELQGQSYKMWTNPEYSEITFSCPNRLEDSMKRAVREGRAEYALHSYRMGRRT